MNVLIITALVLYGVWWVCSELFCSFNNSVKTSSIQSNAIKECERRRNEKFGDRIINNDLSLYERNKDIILPHAKRINKSSYSGRYYIANKIVDCLNDICLAEGAFSLMPNNKYLNQWESVAPSEWLELSRLIKVSFAERQRRLKELEQMYSDIQKKVESISKSTSEYDLFGYAKTIPSLSFNIEEISSILTPNEQAWFEFEEEMLNSKIELPEQPLLEEDGLSLIGEINKLINTYNSYVEDFNTKELQNKDRIFKILDGYQKGKEDSVCERFNQVFANIKLPESLPFSWDLNFNIEEKILIVDFHLPEVVHGEIYKEVSLKKGLTRKSLTQKEVRERVPQIQPAVMLRIAYEAFRNDINQQIDLLVLNGVVEFDDPSTGNRKTAYVASLAVKREQIINLNLVKVEPLAAFNGLKGRSAGKTLDIIPVNPVLTLDREDSRFVDTKSVIEKLDKEANIAAMDWQDFENLIAELFEKEFAKEGLEIKVTQASRDRGVDAIVLDPDPIKGGKFVIQAKRYTNTVDVSAVRDLCAVVRKEGASRGILVTTSSYGADAYEFAHNEPVTLLNGAELLGLLKKHGYGFKIDIQEAKRLNQQDAL